MVSGTGTDGSACLNTCCLVYTVLVPVGVAVAAGPVVPVVPVVLLVSVLVDVVAAAGAAGALLFATAAELVGAFVLEASGLPAGCVGA